MAKKSAFSGESEKRIRGRAARIIDRLEEAYPDAACSLKYASPFQLLVAVVLSAQCTDAKVNAVLPVLFRRYPRPLDLAGAALPELEGILKPLGLFRTKAANIRTIAALTRGAVPKTIEGLMALPGVGRKTANVVLTELFERAEGIAVDTHCGRIARRLGITSHVDPIKVEADLMARIPAERWHVVTHLFIAHGRAVCRARIAYCNSCVLGRSLCPSFDPRSPRFG